MRPTVDQHHEARRLEALHRYQVLDTGPEAAFERIATLAQRLFMAPIVLVGLVAEERQWFKARHGLEFCETDLKMSFCVHAICQDDVMVVPDATKDSRFRDNPLVLGAPGIRFYAGAPLVTPDGYKLGTLCVIDTVPRPEPGANARADLASLAALVMDTLELRYTERQLEGSEARFRALVQAPT